MGSRWMLRGVLMLAVLGLGGLGLLTPAGANGGQDGKIKGVAAGLPPEGIIVPLSFGADPVEFQATFGSPSIAFPVILTSATEVKIDEGLLSATLSNGDAVEVEGSINPDGKLLLDELELEDFLELEIDAFIVDIPGDTTLALPLAAGSPAVTVTFSLVVSGTQFPMVITPETKVEGGPLLLTEGARVEFEALFRDDQIQVHKIELEDEDEDEDD